MMLRLSSLVLILAVLAAITVRVLSIGRRPKNYPPGPPTLPIVGNLHLMPSRDVHVQFQKWAEEYGPVYSLILGTKTLVVLSSPEAIKDLLDRKNAIYSDRLEHYIGQTLASGGLRPLMMGYGAQWRLFRKLAHTLLNVQAAKSYVPYQTLENKQMLYEIGSHPDEFLGPIRRYSNALTTTMVYGWRTPTYRDTEMQEFFEGFTEFAEINNTGTAALVDYFPWLRHLPERLLGAPRRAREMHKKEKALYLRHWLTAKDRVRKGTIKPCFCFGLVKAQEAEGFSDEEAAYIAGTILEAGSDTTSNTLYGFVQAMLLFPEAQTKLQAEIDAVVGERRLPTMDDEAELQCVRACMKETLRWMPTTVMGAVPHATTQDDHYNGFLIPRGAGVVNNVWTIHMDPHRYPDPRRFDPERYRHDRQNLADAAANPDVSQRDTFSFGAGRRICVGMHVAERSMFMAMARMLWAFRVEPVLDEKGKPMLPDPDRLMQGFVTMPEPFRARIVPRSEERRDLVVREWEEAERACLDSLTKQWRDVPVT